MKAIYSLYVSPDSAQRAVNALRAAGFAEREIAIVSSEPLEEYEFGQRDRETWMPTIAVVGGAIGLITAYLLTSLTQMSWAAEHRGDADRVALRQHGSVIRTDDAGGSSGDRGNTCSYREVGAERNGDLRQRSGRWQDPHRCSKSTGRDDQRPGTSLGQRRARGRQEHPLTPDFT